VSRPSPKLLKKRRRKESVKTEGSENQCITPSSKIIKEKKKKVASGYKDLKLRRDFFNVSLT